MPVLQPNVTQKIKIEKYESYPNVQSMVNDLFQNLAAKLFLSQNQKSIYPFNAEHILNSG